MRRVATPLARLQTISVDFYAGKINRDAARAAVIAAITSWLGCSRVSLWRFDGEPGQLSLLCFASKALGSALDTTPMRMDESEYLEYFESLAQRGVFVSDDAMNDRALQPMRAAYLLPNNVLSMLDAAFMVNGRAYGMICCEQTDRQRHWMPPEVAGLRTIVSKLALLMAAGGDPELWGAPSLRLTPLPLSA